MFRTKIQLSVGIKLALLFVASPGFERVVRADSWSLGLGCPGAGIEFPLGIFLASNSGGFSASGKCSRTSTRFTKVSLNDHSGGTPRTNDYFALHTGDVLIIPPILSTETAPIFTVATQCPTSGRGLTWIYVRWGASTYELESGLVLGTGVYSTSTGLSVNGRYDLGGSVAYSGVVPLPGTCSSGLYLLDGIGDRSGAVYFNQHGSGVFQPENGRAIFFFPQQTLIPASNWGNRAFKGLVFDNVSADSTRAVTATASSDGLTLTIEAYQDVENGTIDASASGFTDTLVFSQINTPANGMLFGTLTRTGNGAGTGRFACIAKNAESSQIICSGESPSDPAIPYTLSLVAEGMAVLGQATQSSRTEIEHARQGRFGGHGTVRWLADDTNSRVLIWNTVPTTATQPPDVILGQEHLSAFHWTPQTHGERFNSPQGAHYDGTRFYVADTNHNRVLIWNSLPTHNLQPPDVVLGQPDFTNLSAITPVSASTLNSPLSVFAWGTRLLVADTGNNRVLIWNSIPTTNGAAAEIVLGQSSMTGSSANAGGRSASRLYSPASATGRGTRIFVADSRNHRVLIWTSIPTTNGSNANYQLGQSNFTTATSGSGTQGLNNPQDAFYDGTRFFVAERSNNRVLVWNAVPAASRAAANYVIGQTTMTGTSADSGGQSEYTLSSPRAVYSDGTTLTVSDSKRVLTYNTMPTANGMAANSQLGLPSFTAYDWKEVTAKTLNLPTGVIRVGNKIIIADRMNNRVLIWNNANDYSNTDADVVVGQADFTSSGCNRGSFPGDGGGLCSPYDIASDGTRLFVADSQNYRVAVWNTIPTVSGTYPDYALGQADAGTPVYPAAHSSSTFRSPRGLASDGTRLVVVDSNNERILIYNSIPTSSGAAADLVLGQTDWTSTSPGKTASRVANPLGVTITGDKLLIADKDNGRILIWNEWPTTNAAEADVVVGQADMTSGYSCTSPSVRDFCYPHDVATDGTKLFVADTNNSRIFIWNSIPTTNYQPADAVIGQSLFTSSMIGLGPDRLYLPNSIAVYDGMLYIADSYNNRILITPAP